jgi:N-acetylmuramoyl-L-alanine amidase
VATLAHSFLPWSGRGLVRLAATVACLTVGLLAPVLGSARADPDIRVISVSFTLEGATTVAAIETDRPIAAKVFTLAQLSPRVVVDFPRVAWRLAGTAEQGEGPGVGVVRRYRFAQNAPEKSRLVFDLTAPARVADRRSEFSGGKWRLVLRLEPTDAASFSREAGFPPAVTAAQPAGAVPATAPTAPARRIVVIDAGHGGKDPGAVAASGVEEKSITLAAAQALATILEARGGYQPVLTRSTDVFAPLEERIGKARDIKAHLFISLHADAGARPEVNGASVYTLSEAATGRAQLIRQAENWTLEIEGADRPADVEGVLVDLAQRETKNQSARLAQLMIPELAKVGPVLANTHRRAGFFVLLAPDVPAVILEMGFMTNEKDAEKLATPGHRGALMRAVADAIDAYFARDATIAIAGR